ncbi:octaprenyl-diphosphate synthase [Oceanospirillum multiglobuliferum]|uniref:Octaprenyl diphosphate synthase n=1 Tax=Oceanospirillum multiglobuliferum TaxID=64969 RepID=A0A1T4LX48_9GAMM|nr:octaprenyl diphosphate synthase [Oceanospirillum multiglobuliferum]OPX56330.1 octaprenyl diphosphate synthase [Oceanospirillum multiglobuliferum]SJZ59211.1 octaprenyl-diphosphate synthase [Oceanospirillum multiglobuliferum]
MQPKSAIHDIVADDFSALNQNILEQLHSRVPLVEKIAEYIVDSGGKRLRPLLVLLVCRAFDCQKAERIPLSALVEFIHTATLLHDDVVDESDMRRGRDTANNKWGNAPSVLVGDFLYTRAFELMVNIGDMKILKIYANATNVIAEGEVLQLTNIRNPKITEEQYMTVIKAKTAMLFEAATQSAAILSGATAEQEQALADYGNYLGLAFQMQDDLLDYNGDAVTMGKNVGDDLAEGKATLPLIRAMAVGTEDEAKLIRSAIRKGGLEYLNDVLAIVQRTGALEYTEQKALEFANQAKASLACLPESIYRERLAHLADLAVQRKN